MIKPSEVSKIANKEGVRPQQIEKDYIISWILWGIANDDLLKKALIFKGGTCLKKIYFEDYRYSEDMDFTLNPDMETNILDNEIYSKFNRIFREIKEFANIDISIPESSKDFHETSGSIKFYIDYVGPLGGNGDHVKMDITRGEKLEFDIHQGIVIHQYSDLEEESETFKVQSYK